MDFETGGFDFKKHSAMEFAGIWIDSSDFREICRYESIIKPYDENHVVDPKAFAIHGITPEESAAGEELSVVVQKIFELTELANEGKSRGGKTILVGQNIDFDIAFLQDIFKRTKREMSKIFAGSKDFFGNFQPARFDTLHLGLAKYANIEDETGFSLSDLCLKEGVDIVDAHRAMNDVEPTKELFIKFLMNLRNNSSTEGVEKFNFRKTFKFQI